MKLGSLVRHRSWRALSLGCLVALCACEETEPNAAQDSASDENEAAVAQLDGGGSSSIAGDADASPALDAESARDARVSDASDAGVPLDLPEVDAMVLLDGGKVCFTPPWGMIDLSEASVFALEGCSVLRGDLHMGDQSNVRRAPFPQSLREVEGTLNFFRNPQLEDLSELRNLVVVGRLLIHANDALETLSGLESLRAVRDDLLLTSNQRLRSVSALSGLQTAGELRFGPNGELPESELERLRSMVKIVPRDAGI